MALYGSTTVSDTFGEGTTEYVFMIRSGYSSRILEMSKVPMPDPVPPPRECVSWKPCFHMTAKLLFYNLVSFEMKKSCLPEGNRSSRLLCGQRQEQSRPIQLLQCSDLWPSCYRLHFGQRRNCQGGRAGQMVPNERNPWCQAPNPQEQHGEHICLRLLHYSRH